MNDIITFEKGEYTKTFTYKEKPVIHISSALFDTKDKKWVTRLYPASILIKIQKFDQNNKFLGFSEVPLLFSQFISSDHIEPALEVNKTVHFLAQTQNDSTSLCSWEVSIILRDIELQDNEKIDIKVMDKEYIIERVIDWEKRIFNLYSEVRSWLRNDSNYLFREGKTVIMNEGLMEEFEVSPKSIPTLDLLHNNALILSFKPKGLWIIGANGRIDILSLKIGGLILIDMGENLQLAKWHLVDNTKIKQPWSKDLFLNLINA